MKKLLFTLAVAFVSTLSINAQKTTKSEMKGAQIEFEQEVIDYGTIAHNADGKREFVLKNTGDAPLVITRVKGSCGCTVPTKPTAPILPGKTGIIKVKYATNRVGSFSKTVTVTSNAVNAPSKVVRIKGKVLPDAPSVMEKKPTKKTVQVDM